MPNDSDVKFISGESANKVALYPALFSVDPNVILWKVEGSIRAISEIYGLASSQSSLVLATNKLPTGGSCSIDPLEGITMDTEFTVVCQNWTDIDGNITKYEFYGKLYL